MRTARLATTIVLALLAACTRAAEPAAALDAAGAAQAESSGRCALTLSIQ